MAASWRRLLAAAALALAPRAAAPRSVSLSNVALPLDSAGNALLTGEATVLRHGSTWYVYLNDWGGCPGVDCCGSPSGCASCCFSPPSSRYPDACVYTSNHSVVVYATPDFVAYDFLGVALPLGARRPGVEFRPQVVFNNATQLFVMWYEDRWSNGGSNPGYAVATSATPQGPFSTIADTVRMAPGGGRIGDYDLFIDDDGVAYHVRTGLTIERLNASYTGVTGESYNLPNSGVEGPSMFRRGDTYYLLVGLGCCACRGGSNVVVYTAAAPMGPYVLQGDVGSNTTAGHVFSRSSPYNFVTRAQGSKVVPVVGADGATQFLWLGNAWVTAKSGERNQDLLYWTVLQFDAKGAVQQIVRADAAVLSLPDSAAVASPSPIPDSPIPEPYPWLNGGSFGAPVAASHDDLVAYSWPADFAGYGALQIFAAAPAFAQAAAGSSCASGLDSLVAAPFGAGAAAVSGNCSLLLDFGVERAAWLELQLAAPLPACAALVASISEYNTPRPGLAAALKAFGDGSSLRLETNAQLYDGLRYAFLTASAAPGCAPVVITGVRAVTQALPLNYEGAFASDDELLDRVYYTGAYSVRANALPGFFGSELLDRGDRAPPFQGDAHVAQRAGLAAFGGEPLYALARAMLALTDSANRSVHDSNIASYPLHWVLSVTEFFEATGDTATFASYATPSVTSILDGCFANLFNWSSPTSLRWSGWDDRLGSGFSSVDSTPEARRFLWMMTLKAASRFAAAATHVTALAPLAAKYDAKVAAVVAQLRASGPNWFATRDGGYGVHSCAAAITGGWTMPAERDAMFAAHFNNSAGTIACSFSNFDTGFLLDALAEMGRADYGGALVRQCWGRQLAAGATCLWESNDGAYDSQLAAPISSLGGRIDMDLLPGASTSACHAWGAGPTAWLPRHALGVAPLLPGFARFAVAPALLGFASGALRNVSGRVPTPHGAVAASAQLDSRGALRLRVRGPQGTTASVRLPRELLGSGALLSATFTFRSGGSGGVLDRRALDLEAAEEVADARGRLSVVLPDLAFGKDADEVEVEAVYVVGDNLRGESAAGDAPLYPPYGPPSWPVAALAIDNATHGAWVGRVGAAGYVLFGFDPAADPQSAPPTDRADLPAFIANVSVAPNAVRSVLAAPAQQPTEAWLQDPAAPATRRLGAAGVGSTGGLYGLFLDVFPAPGAPDFRLTVYVADTQPAGSAPQSMLVRAEDAATRSALAPDVLVRTFVPSPFNATFNAGGAWGLERGIGLSLDVRGGAATRVRLYCVAGCAASMSAVFFDTL